ncbi:O-methyltransferase [Kitasatospora aureofaciens]|uniref:Methyltransferase n=1 Tax=Kitasatospora aureofaciens TaxID=1894 RepID=A0A1E7N3V3_KITAU|nr:O-methyltransferase [Kitasatospora aureofaciens]QEV03013.1 O-methyltransferase [Streptomyces viridifaciens]OEV35352.1 methyltransferase [Kitasatospora aureofaciens]UKZ09652.1 O-methyltransferase [Streptomyces viridifaciens]GGU58378.1 O-methyltransferase [Kitasatospora aureofaciens]HJD84052.1 O-methyltransferase [Kitasatospora aureofaciens]
MTQPTQQTTWNAVDAYFSEQLVGHDPALEAATAAADAAGLPKIAVAPNQGKLLHLLALTQGARRILEVGTLGGYSTIWLARALPADGTLISLELDPRHAEVARGNLARAGLGEVAEVRVGRAADSLAALVEQGEEPFDLVFIDADKPSNPEYFRRALQLTGPGSLIIVDNVVRGGAIADAASTDPAIVGTRTLHELIAAEPRVTGTSVQTVGSKGYDGFTLVRVQG